MIPLVLITSLRISQSQTLAKSRTSSYYTFIYKISNDQAKDLIEKNFYFPPDKYFTQLVDSFPSDSLYKKKLEVGHYLKLFSKKDRIHCRMETVSNLQVDLYNNDRDLILFIHKKNSSEPITNALVKVERRKLSYNPQTENYELFNTNKTGLVTIVANNETIYLNLKKEYNHYSKYNYRTPRREKYQGYLVTNKPKYLPNDTVKWKAYITNRNGRPIKRSLKMKLRDRKYSGKEIFSSVLEPQTDGAFFGEFILGDSLRINKDYFITLTPPRSYKTIIKNSFYLEDYQLDEAKYNILTPKDYYHYGDQVEIYLEGVDANGLNLLNSRVDIKVITKDIIDVFADKEFIPKVLWTTEKDLDPVGETKLIIPDSLFPNAEIEIEILAVFNNSNNETHEEEVTFIYNGKKNRIDYRFENDSLYVVYLESGKSVPNYGKAELFNDNGLVKSTEIKFPISLKINPYVDRYEFKTKEERCEIEMRDIESLFHSNCSRVGDSLFVNFINQRKINVTYSVFDRKNKSLVSGTGVDLDTMIICDPKKSYFITYNYMWAGRSIESSDELLFFNKKLNVDIHQPKRIYPGQNVKVKIKVTDADNEPISNVNICASSLNNQFGYLDIPDVPYLGKTPKKRPYYRGYLLNNCEFNSSKRIDTTWFKKLRLDTINYYQIVFPKNGFATLYDSSCYIKNTQFSPYIFHKGKQQDIYMIYLDDELLYYSGNNNELPYSLVVTAGIHDVRLRTEYREYFIDNVIFKENQKLELSLEYDSISENVRFETRKPYLNEEESDNLRYGFIQLNNNFNQPLSYLVQDDNVVKIENHRYSRRYGRRQLTLGPFYTDSLEFVVTNSYATKFFFEPEYTYTINKGLIKLVRNYEFLPGSNIKMNDKQELGDILYPIHVKYSEKISYWDKYLLDIHRGASFMGSSSFIYEYTGDSSFTVVQMKGPRGIEDYRFYKGETRKIPGISPGHYSLNLVTASGTYYKYDSIYIKQGGTTYCRIGHGELQIVNPYLNYKPSKSGSNYTRSYRTSKSIKTQGRSSIRGKISDAITGEPIPFANIVVEKNGTQYGGTTSDFDGNYQIKPIPSGKYNVRATFVGYQTVVLEDVYVGNRTIRVLDIELKSAMEMLSEVMIINYKVPLISKDQTSSGTTVTANAISRMPNRSASAVATTVGGVYSNNEERSSLRGARTEQTATFIDGVRVDNFFEKSGPDIENIQIDEFDYKVNNQNPGSIRSRFVDYAYWQPNMITDENGEVSFNVRFPDNITSWKSYALAMGSKKRTGKGVVTTLSYSDLSAQLSTPRFLITGDSTTILGKVSNYTSTPFNIKTTTIIEDSLVKELDTIVVTSVIEKIPANIPKSDTAEFVYKLKCSNGFVDGEERKIPVLPLGVKESQGEFYILSGDTSITINPDVSEYNVFIGSSEIVPLLDELEKLENYPYYCMEQSASKLIGLLLERDIKTNLGTGFNKDYKIKTLIRRLKRGRNEDGSWGWWTKGRASIWMTSYVMKSLSEAKKYSFEIPDLSLSVSYLQDNLATMHSNEMLYALSVLSSLDVRMPYIKYIRELQEKKLTQYQEFKIIEIMQKAGLEYSIDKILDQHRTTILGGIFWGEYKYSWYNNINNTTLLAYSILEKHDSTHSYLPKIRNYYFENMSNSIWYSTINKSQIIRTILPGVLREFSGDSFESKITFKENSEFEIEDFPFVRKIVGSPITINKSGLGTAFVSYFSEDWNSSPKRLDSLYSVRSWFQKDGKILDSLVAGQITELKVTVVAKKAGKYIMINVPIPAACSYADNKGVESLIESHREYFKHQTSIFVESLNKGTYTFTIRLQPRFSGRYYLNPVLVESMYFPTNYGRNSIKNIVVE